MSGAADLWRPLRTPIFRQLLIADVVSDVGTFMQGVGSAWLMVSIGASPLFVALTQTASALPFFLLALQTYYGPNELADSMRSVRRHTVTIAEDIPEERYDYRPAPGSRSVRATLLHMASITQFDLRVHGEDRLDSLEGFDFRAFFASLPTSEKLALSKAETVALLQEEGERWYRFVQQLPAHVLAEKVRMRPGANATAKSRFEMLLGTKDHEMHHRGQLMIIERLQLPEHS